ncbi:MAG: VOC family protein [Steroidobacteraceae bacterium]
MSSFKPPAHPAVSPYLLVTDAQRMLGFLSATFGAVELFKVPRPDGSVQHAEVRIDDSIIMMGERPNDDGHMRCSTHVYVPDVDACYARALAAGAASVAEPRDQSYGNRSAGITDVEGNLWWIGTHLS